MIDAVTSETVRDLQLGPCRCMGCGLDVHWDGARWVQVFGSGVAVPHRCKEPVPLRPTSATASPPESWAFDLRHGRSTALRKVGGSETAA